MFARLTFVLLFCVNTVLFAVNYYNQGYRAYIRYVKHIPKYGMKSTQLLKKLNVHSEKELAALFKNNGKLLIEKVQKFNPKAAEGLKKIVKKGKLKAFQKFLTDVFNGKVPPGCL